MKSHSISRRIRVGAAIAALMAGFGGIPAAAPAAAQPKAYTSGTYRPSTQVLLSLGEGQMINLSRSVASVWTSNPEVADVFVNGPRQMNLFGKKAGEATVIATAADGSVVYGANVRVNQNISSINNILREAMPGSNISVTNVGQVAVLNGTVASPEDAAQAEMLVKAALNPGIDIHQAGAALTIVPVSRLKVATPLQVMLKVRIAEINRTLMKSMGVNLLSRDNSGGFLFGIGRGNPGSFDGDSAIFNIAETGTTLGAAGSLLGLDLLGTLGIAANDGLASILAEPNLTALSGETASFLAGGEFPIPVSQGNQAVTIEYKQYGVGLAFTPVVLADGRISMRVRPEVSQLSDAGSVQLGGYTIPALTTRRAETTVELGSGQSFMIAGLIQNTANNSVNKTPLLGDIPVLGSLFRSTRFQRQETELVVVVTPYLVRPVSGRLALPTDGLRVPTDAQRDLLGQTFTGRNGAQPTAVVAPAPAAAGAIAAPGFKL